MEILIIGGAVVALMVYVSTRIKKSAASAFEEETIEGAEFSLVKPDGFLSPIREESEYAFEAFSKDFGVSDEAERFRQVSATLKKLAGSSLAQACGAARDSVDRVVAEEINEADGGINVFTLDGEKSENGVESVVRHKIVEKDGRIFDLEVSALRDHEADYTDRIDRLLDSFRVK
jgi:hypothetical protein